MTEKGQEFVNNCFRIFSVLDQLDEIGDSDNDNVDFLRKYKQSQNSELCVEEIAPVKSKQLVEYTDRKCGNPTKGLLDGQNPLEILSNEQFVKIYRFSKECVEDILQMISYGLEKFTNRGRPFPPILQLLITLQFLTTGSEIYTVCVHKDETN